MIRHIRHLICTRSVIHLVSPQHFCIISVLIGIIILSRKIEANFCTKFGIMGYVQMANNSNYNIARKFA